ncbi:MAG TPA: S-layer glycoprotein N-glycosyltransferase AglJ [Methanocorpusculum sp.]|nr:S-layer glycoprotein N-glycosyltransferase AglJ [Methanocorpusculum sp.]
MNNANRATKIIKKNINEKTENRVSKDNVCVLIPTLNEKATIGYIIRGLQAKGYHQILVVDGHSTDGTPKIAEKLGAKVIKQEGKGKGAALIEAFEKITTPYILMLDGDGTNPPEYADSMIEPLIQDRADHVIGNRLEQYERGALTHLNLWGNYLMNILFKWAHGVYMDDILSGYRAFTLDSIRLMNLTEKGFGIETEICAAVIHYGLRFEIVPTYYKKRQGSPTKLHPILDGYKIIRTINKYSKINNPLCYLRNIGILISIVCFCLEFYVLSEWWITGTRPLIIGILTSLLLITGAFAIMMGSISKVIHNIQREQMQELRMIHKKLNEIEKEIEEIFKN